MIKKRKVVIVGAGNVGASTVLRLLLALYRVLWKMDLMDLLLLYRIQWIL